MNITLIGMSNIGKTYWAERLVQDHGFERIDCDALVEESLGPELARLGYAGIRDVAKWMGQPYDPQYPSTSARFVECERRVMQTIVETLQMRNAEKPIVVDTCGSVIYTGDDICSALRRHSQVLYLMASSAHVDELFKRYIAEPKPVIWGSAFAPNPGEAPTETLARCYPDLLNIRAKRYSEMSHLSLPFEMHRDRAVKSQDFLSMMRKGS